MTDQLVAEEHPLDDVSVETLGSAAGRTRQTLPVP